MERKERAVKLAKNIFQILLLGVLYYIFVRVTGIKIPCLFYVLTGKYCPGCGVTRMCVALIEGDFQTAMRNNLFVFSLLIPGSLYGIAKAWEYIKNGTVQQRLWEKMIVILIFIFMIIFTVLRNTSYGAFLQPI